MEVYRGPQSLPFNSSNSPSMQFNEGVDHELVDARDLSNEVKPWIRKTVISAKISKNAQERHAVAHIVLEEKDVIALFRGLMDGLLKRRKDADEASQELSSLIMRASFGIDNKELEKSLNRMHQVITNSSD